MRLATSCAAGAIVVATSLAAQPREADGIQASWIAPHVRFLSDSALQGRDTGSAEYQIAANYVASQFELLGLKPAGGEGSYFQKLRVRKSAVVTGSASLTLDDAAGQHALQFDREFLLHPSSIDTAMDVSAPLVFVGFSIVAPEAHYDDYAGVDARGKIVVFLPGPSAVQPVDVRGIRSTMAERAAAAKAHGAVGMIELLPGVDVDAAREHYVRQLDATQWLDDDGRPHSGFFGDVAFAMVTREGAAAMLREFPQPLEQVREKLKAGPFSFPLKASATLRARFEHRDMTTVNVAAVRPGSDRSNEYVVYSAHLDHDGVSDYFKGDRVLHGALDNAGGAATVLADARAFMAEAPPHRSVLFLMVTGEEKGLVGSDYYAHHPTVPRESIVANINCDNFLWYFPVKDVSGVGLTYSSLETDFSAAAADVGIHATRPVMPLNGGNPIPLIVMSDHYSFLRAGIPAVSIFNGEDSGDGKRTGSQVFADYMRDVHHTPKDSVDQAIDWGAAVMEARFAFALGRRVANDPERPRFKSGAPFGHAGTRP